MAALNLTTSSAGTRPRSFTSMPCALAHSRTSVVFIEDLLGGLRPHERPGILVPGLDPGADVFFQGLHALAGPAADHLIGQEPEPAFHLVDPRRSGRGECTWNGGWRATQSRIAGVLCVARLSQTRWTSSSPDTGLSIATRNFLNSTARCWRCSSGDHRPIGDVERGEQAGYAVAGVVVGAPLGHAGIIGNTGWDRSRACPISHPRTAPPPSPAGCDTGRRHRRPCPRTAGPRTA